MKIVLAKESQEDRRLPTFKDIKVYDMFAFTHLGDVSLFMKMPQVTQAGVIIGSDEVVESGEAYCFNTKSVVKFQDEEDYFKKVKAIEVEVGEEFIPLEVLKEELE